MKEVENMNAVARTSTCLLLLLLVLAFRSGADVWPIERVANNNIQLGGQPALWDYHAVDVFPGLHFTSPLTIATLPGESNRMFVVEKTGRIHLIEHLDSTPTQAVFLDLSEGLFSVSEAGLLSMAFHPDFQVNGWFFVYRTVWETTDQGTGIHDRLSRFQVDPENLLAGLVGSEVQLINQYDEHYDHNGGGLAFGPDGYLYLTVGDEGLFYDRLNNSQRIDKDFFSGMFRLDVDMRPGNLAPNPHPAVAGGYLVPIDNPFVGAETFAGQPVDPAAVRTEFYAVGLRNSWRFSFDSESGALLANDTGGHIREEINHIVKGGNYGWARREGSLPGVPGKADYSDSPEFIKPVQEYGRHYGDDAAAALYYRGAAYPELDGHYLFSDFYGGYIGEFEFDGSKASDIRWIMHDGGISDMAVHPGTGEILLVDLREGIIKRLVRGPDPQLDPLPGLLSETGAFSDVQQLVADASLVPFEVNVPLWSDGAIKSRWYSSPTVNPGDIGFNPVGNWSLRSGSVFVKHFEIETTNGVPQSRRRLETRFIRTTGGSAYGVTYRWNAEQTDAVLVGSEGDSEMITIYNADGSAFRQQLWRYPSRRECLSCHNGGRDSSQWVLGFNVAQLNREVRYAGVATNQLLALNAASYFNTDISDQIHTLPALAPLDDESASLEFRVRSYLMANCADCHESVPGKSRARLDVRYYVPLAQAEILDAVPHNWFGIDGARTVHLSDPEKSILLKRMETLGIERMPPLATSVVDTNAVALIRRWITEDLSRKPSFGEWIATVFPDELDPRRERTADPDGDRISNEQEHRLGTHPMNAHDPTPLELHVEGGALELAYTADAGRYFRIEWTDDLDAPGGWRPLNVEENEPRLLSDDRLVVIRLVNDGGETRYFRYVVREY